MPLYSYTTEAGDLTVDRHYEAGKVPSRITVKGRIYWRDFAPRKYRNPTPGHGGGCWQLSRSNGVVGTEKELAAAKRLDAQLGVSINYVKTHEKVNARGEKVCAWRAEYQSRAEKNRWLRSHGRVDFDAAYSDPAPSGG